MRALPSGVRAICARRAHKLATQVTTRHQNFKFLTISISTIFEFFQVMVRSSREKNPGIVLSTPDLTLKHVPHTQFRKFQIFEHFEFFEPALGRVEKWTPDSTSEPKK